VIDILLVARNHFLIALRERITLFWFLIFPVFLLVILSFVFGGLGEDREVAFDVSMVNFDRESTGAFSGTIAGIFDGLGRSETPDVKPLFQLRRPATDEPEEIFLESELLALRRGRRAAVIVIPAGLDRRIATRLIPAAAPRNPAADGEVSVTIYYSEGNATSTMAVSIIDQVVAGIDRAILAQGGWFDQANAISSSTTWIGSTTGETSYVDFLLPGIILMGLFTSGLFGVPGSILFSRDQRVLRRYWVTPLTVPRFLAGMSIGHALLSVLQFAILFAVGRFALGATLSFASLEAVLYLLLAAATFMAFGFLIASLAKTANSGMAIANILNMPMMFLSGLFFPITGLPTFIKAIVYVNPVSYLADGLRASVGVESGVFPTSLVVAVPLAWIAVSSGIAAWRLRWDVGR
jgi:ABC-2 type transport system permease protein